MKLLDVNILVQVHREDADLHKEVAHWLEITLLETTGVAVSELVLSGFLRVVTHPKVFKVPTPLASALDFIDDLRSRESVRIVAPGLDHWKIFTTLCKSADARGNLMPDAYHAALAMETGCEWITLDRGFGRYRGLRWRHPLD
jgi:hypothetical protein